MIKNVKFAEIIYIYKDCFLEYTNFKDDLKSINVYVVMGIT